MVRSNLILFLVLFFITSCEISAQGENDSKALDNLLARVNANGDINDPTTPRPLVTLEEFFGGNNDYASIGYNFYPEQPSPQEFYKVFLEIRDKPEVYDVRVQVNDQSELGAWPATDTIWIITSEKAETVESWIPELFHPDDVIIGFSSDAPYQYEDYKIPEGMQAIGIWWD